MWGKFRERGYCERCGKKVVDTVKDSATEVSKVAMEWHHLIPVSEGGEEIPSNQVWICANCHREIGAKMKSIGYIKPKKSRMGRGRRALLELYGVDVIGQIYEAERKRIGGSGPSHQCPQCSSLGSVTEVAEFAKSIYVQLTCSRCGHQFVTGFW